MNRRRGIHVLIGAFATTAVMAAAHAAETSKSAAKLSPEDLRSVNKLLGEYRAAGADTAKKDEICKKALDIGPGATPLILAAVQRDASAALHRYDGKFQQQALRVAKKKLAKVDLKEVAQLRQTVLGLQKLGDGFTKEVIVEKGDPAMHRLQEMFVVDRAAVLEQSTELQSERKSLEALGQIWQRCKTAMPIPPLAKGQDPPKPFDFVESLDAEEDAACAATTPMDPRTKTILAYDARLVDKIDPEEAKTIMACNLMRNLLGLPSLAIDLKLCDAARDHSNDMETLKFFSHESPVDGKKAFTDRAKRMGTTASGENIFFGSRDGKVANEAWFHSPGHHVNMLANHVRIGVGRAGTHFTEMFGN